MLRTWRLYEGGMEAVGGGEAGGGEAGGAFGRDGVVGETADGEKEAFGPSSTIFGCLVGKSSLGLCNGWSFGWTPTSLIWFPWDTFSSAFRPCCFKLSSRSRSTFSRSSKLRSRLRSASFRFRYLSLRSLLRFRKSSCIVRLCSSRRS